ncbi:MAG: Tryptophanyl-tRNA synthetase, partial [uncultured Phycisphaerae bacterium]
DRDVLRRCRQAPHPDRRHPDREDAPRALRRVDREPAGPPGPVRLLLPDRQQARVHHPGRQARGHPPERAGHRHRLAGRRHRPAQVGHVRPVRGAGHRRADVLLRHADPVQPGDAEPDAHAGDQGQGPRRQVPVRVPALRGRAVRRHPGVPPAARAGRRG